MEGRGRKSVLERSWRSVEDFSLLRTVLPFVTAHAFRDDLRNLDFLWAGPTNASIFFCAVYSYAGKADLSKDYWYPKRKLGLTVHFSEITAVQVGKKTSYIALCFN